MRPYDEEAVIAAYLWGHYPDLFSETELKANRLAILHAKNIPERFAESNLDHGVDLNDPELNALVADGVNNFRRRAAQRVMREHPQTVRFNRCPKCHCIVATPKAQQCLWCGHDWHPRPHPNPLPAYRERGPENSSFISHAKIIGIITFVSRILGLVREMIVARYFGPSSVLSAFKYAFVLPNLFRKLLGEGALSAAFIPLYTKSVKESDGASHVAFASAAVSLQLAILVALTVVVEALLVAILFIADLRSETALALKLAIVMMPYVVFVCGAALLGGILQVHKRFIASTATAILLNALMIVAIAFVARRYDLTTEPGQRAAVWWLAVSVLVAGAGQVLLLAPSLRKCGFRFHLTTHLWNPAIRRMMLMSIPVALSLGVLQLGVVLDKQIALMMSPQDAGESLGHFLGLRFTLPMELGALARLDWAQYLYQFPLGVFGIAIATAIFPQLSGDALDIDRAQFRSILSKGIKASLFIGLPASVGMVLVALPAVRLLFERGQFTYHDSQLTALSTAIYSSAIWAFSVQQILNRAYYALHDMRTPLVWSILNLIINLVVEIPLLWWMGESAMAVGTLVSFFVQTTVMTLLLARQLGLPLGEFLPESGKMLFASGLMILPCGALRWLVKWPDNHLGYALEMTSVMAVGGATYFAACYALRLPMESLVPARFRRRAGGET